MNPPDAQSWLQAWEQAQGRPPMRRPLALLECAWPDIAPQAWGALPLGERDRWLLALHEALFGPELDTVAACPACGEPLELCLPASALCRPAPDEDLPAELQGGPWQAGLRLPGSDDLIAVLGEAPAGRSALVERLLQRCLLDLRHEGEPAPLSDLPPAVAAQWQQEMARRDPGADNRVALTCPACGHGFERRLDIAEYLWDELDDWARKTLAEVHLLACAYGWSEAQILSLGLARRRHYLGLVQA